MEFKLPFPTLKSLSCLRICLHWADNKIGPFKDFPTTRYSGEETLRESLSHLSIDGLQIPRSLKAVVGDVLCGIWEQLCFWRNKLKRRLAPEVQFFHFDAYGRFDEQRTLKPVFQKKVAEEDDMQFLHTLLTEAFELWLLPEVDAIIRKMVAIMASDESKRQLETTRRLETRRQSEILMEGPRTELRDGLCYLVYRFVQEDAAQTLKTIRYSGNAWIFEFDLEQKSIATRPGIMHHNFDGFKVYLDLLEPSEREYFIEDFLYYEMRWYMGIKDRLDILAVLKQKNYQQNWMLEHARGDIYEIFEDLLTWPFTSFFIVAFKHFAPRLKIEDYRRTFSFIIRKLPGEQQYGGVHRSLLEDYWSVLTADVKRWCIISGYLNGTMRILKLKAPILHEKFRTDIN